MFAVAGAIITGSVSVTPGVARAHRASGSCPAIVAHTGALASAITAGLTDVISNTEAEVHMPGGTLGVGYTVEEGTVSNVYLLGNVETVYRGTLEV